MALRLPPTLEHIRLMESRVEQQIALIEQLSQSGQDTLEALSRLNLLQRALHEMRIQLGHLSPTEKDSKRDIAAALRMLSERRKSG